MHNFWSSRDLKSRPNSSLLKTLRTFRGVGALCLVLSFTGCFHYVFSAHGTVASDGGPLGQWSSKPQGCSRDPQDGLPIGQTASLFSFFWEDPASSDPAREQHMKTAPDAPMRLDLARTSSGLTATLDTVKTRGTTLDQSTCSLLQADTQQHKPDIRDGKPTLAGRLQMDCHAGNSHVTADVTFTRCEY